MSTQQLDLDMERLTAYGYYQWRIIEPLALTAGIAYDRLTITDIRLLTIPLAAIIFVIRMKERSSV